MTSNTIDSDRTMSGSEGTLLANRYRIVRQLGQGGMGSVWLAEDTLLDNKPFAIKMLPSILVSNKRAYAQLKSEALVAMKLVHPNIVQIRAFEENEGNPFLVMDYIDGQTLDDYLADVATASSPSRNGGDAVATSGLSEQEVVRLLKPIAAALDYAHKKGVVHRDVKPGNIMIAKDGTPYILDFGISREMQETMTRVTGKLSSGTLLYMSPEQLRGLPPKPAQDVYSFAAMAYECMSGHPPFYRGAIEDQIKNEQPEPLVGRVDPNAPQSIANSIMSGLAKRPEDRPATCAGVLAVKDVNRAEHVERVDSGGTRLSRPQGSHTLAKVFGILALLAALAVVASYGWTKYSEGVKAKDAEIERMRKETAARWEADRKANEERIAKLRAEKEAAEAEKRRIAAEKEAAEAEKRKIEAEREEQEKERAAERARLEKAKSAPVQPSVSENLSLAEQEARQKEVARLAELRVDIEIKFSDAKEKMERIAAYRGEPDGFQSHIANADAKWQAISGAERKPAAVAEAETSFKLVSEAEGAIAKELHWLKTNKAARDGAKALEAEIARDIDPGLKKFKADDYARVAFREGAALRKDGNSSLAKGDFQKASEKLQSAKAKLSEAASSARKFCIDTHLNTARKWNSASKWQQCVEECNTVLGWDALNAEAKKLKADAESHLVPTANVIATINGREVEGAKLSDGKKDHLTPISWTFKDGASYGPYEVAYESGGKRYFGTFSKVVVDWRGQKTFTVALKEYIGPKHGDTKKLVLPGGVTMEMIYVAPGSFAMGSPTNEEGHESDETQHRVTLTKGYWFGKYEVTQAQWRSVMGTDPSNWKGDNLPVENVSWNDCQEFIRKVGAEARRQLGGVARLPTEAEWEYACRAGTTTAYSWGNALNGDKANCDGNYPCGTTAKGPYSRHETAPVGSYAANPWGFYDMHGNVWEWCSDWYGNYSGNATDPIGSASGVGRVLRGGSWGYCARFCRSASRIWIQPDIRDGCNGFRLCCSAGPRE